MTERPLIEQTARLIYSFDPNGSFNEIWDGTNQEGKIKTYREFVAYTWEKAPDRHVRCLREAREILEYIRSNVTVNMSNAGYDYSCFGQDTGPGGIQPLFDADEVFDIMLAAEIENE